VELDKDMIQELTELLKEPAKASVQDAVKLEELLQKYPYYQPLHLLLAKANMQLGEERNSLAKASLYTNGRLLHKLLFNETVQSTEFHIINQAAEITQDLPLADEQETFEEIAEVDLSQYRPFRNSGEQQSAPITLNGETADRKPSLEDDFVFESIASSDFFAFEENFNIEHAEEPEQEPIPTAPEELAEQPAADTSQVSNYNDEKLPYTFLWWLAKTRKEHQSIFQPYATPKKEQSNELQQQYVEHIFHVQSHLPGTDALQENEEQVKPVTKDLAIIENFIRKDPQITAPNAEQIDNENKAKKSAEDQNDLVSETLANIYIEQMLYEKAIDTYQKLSLKFPEKSRYFADLIQSIEKKI